MFAITSGLNNGVVQRLKQTKEKLPAKYIKWLEEMSSMMDPSMNFRKYRNLISSSPVSLQQKVWKFSNFSVTQFLREINFENFRTSNSSIFDNLEAPNFDFGK